MIPTIIDVVCSRWKHKFKFDFKLGTFLSDSVLKVNFQQNFILKADTEYTYRDGATQPTMHQPNSQWLILLLFD
jgi:hypothetical protein